MDVIVFQEHWLWPFKRHILQSISDQYSFTLVCDNRLNPLSDLCHGCGGVAILWKKCLAKCHPFPSIWFESDRICAIKVALPNSNFLTTLGFYMPSADQSQEIYSSYLDVLSSAISELPPDSPLLIVGDLNCHLGHLGGHRSTDLPNAWGHLWKELVDHESLFIPSVC